MSNHRNSIIMIVSLLLLFYALLLSIYPSMLSSTFNRAKFEEKIYKAAGLVTTVDDIEFKMKPNLTLIITIRNWSSKHIVKDLKTDEITDYQDCFDAKLIELQTGAFAPLTKNFKIKDMYMRYVTYADQILPGGDNKLAYLPKSFEASAFGARNIKIGAGPVKIRDFQIQRITPDTYAEDNRKEQEYTKEQVKKFLQEQNIRYVKVK